MIRPIWREILDEHRGIGQAEDRTGGLPAGERSEEIWPPMLVPSRRLTLDLWEQVEENRQATNALQSAIEHPGQHLNPIHISGLQGIGKSHLVTACAQTFQEQLGPASVRMVRCGLLAGEKGAWPIPPQEIEGLRVLVIEDLDQILEQMGRLQEMAGWLLWQVSCGVQVVLTSDGTLRSDESSGDLRRLLEASVDFNLPPYSKVSMMRMLRRRCTRREVMISDQHLQALIDAQGENAPRLFASFEKMCIAEADGSLSSDPAEAILNLSGAGTAYQAIFADDDPADAAREITAQALEETESTEFVLDSPPLEIEPEFDPRALIDAEWDTSDLSDPNPSLSHAQLMEEEDAALREAWSEGFELPEPVPPTEELLAELSTKGLDRMADVGLAFEGYNQLLESVESEMKELGEQLENADSETLLQLADKLVHLEGSLQSLRPASSELEPFRFATRSEPEADLPDLDKLRLLDEYVPEGTWDVDEDDVSVDDLFGMTELQPVSLKVLVPSESIPKLGIDIEDQLSLEVTPADSRRQRDTEGKLDFVMPDVMDRQVGVTRHKREEHVKRTEQDRRTAARAETWRATVEQQPEEKVLTEEDELMKKFAGTNMRTAIQSEEEPVRRPRPQPEEGGSRDKVVKKIIRQPIDPTGEEEKGTSKPDEDEQMDKVVKKIVHQPKGAPAAGPEQAFTKSTEDEQMDKIVKKIVRQPQSAPAAGPEQGRSESSV